MSSKGFSVLYLLKCMKSPYVKHPNGNMIPSHCIFKYIELKIAMIIRYHHLVIILLIIG